MPLTTVTVNQNDIDTGVPKDCWACPIQKAVQKITRPDVTITVGDIHMIFRLWNKDSRFTVGSYSTGCLPHEIALPDIAITFIADFDEHGPTAVKPISFQIDVPKVYLRF